jgi:hypothetical protein
MGSPFDWRSRITPPLLPGLDPLLNTAVPAGAAQAPVPLTPGAIELGAGLSPGHDAALQHAVANFLAAQQAGAAAPVPEIDPQLRQELERLVRERFAELNRQGVPLEARPGSKLAEALATGDLSQLSGTEMVAVLVALLSMGANRRDPGSVAQRHDAPLAPRGAWKPGGGNIYGGGTSQTGPNASADAPRGPAPSAGPIPGATGMGGALATAARDVANSMGTTGWCYRGVKAAVARATGVQLQGGSAYQAADQLAGSGRFREISVSPDQLRQLPPGAVVVWGKTAASPHGHISVSLGNGQEASDHIQTQMTSLRGAQNYRVFVPNQ